MNEKEAERERQGIRNREARQNLDRAKLRNGGVLRDQIEELEKDLAIANELLDHYRTKSKRLEAAQKARNAEGLSSNGV